MKKEYKRPNQCFYPGCTSVRCSEHVFTTDDNGKAYNEVSCRKHQQAMYKDSDEKANGTMRCFSSSTGVPPRKLWSPSHHRAGISSMVRGMDSPVFRKTKDFLMQEEERLGLRQRGRPDRNGAASAAFHSHEHHHRRSRGDRQAFGDVPGKGNTPDFADRGKQGTR